MPRKRNKADKKSNAAASAAAADSPPGIVKVETEDGKTGTTADTAVTINESSPPVVIQQGSSSSSSSSSSPSSIADEQLTKKVRAEMTKNISKHLTCSITLELMAYPVMAEDGNTYEKGAILNWLEEHSTSPLDPSTTTEYKNHFGRSSWK